ncbi:MAG TPA: prepilin-type N-terminal cleavage/methylation domain-containing protein [Gemmatimonadota bacterium]|jgi:prepilin-type N-terminal cleavage/methylation domain-containing protein
MSPTRTSPSQAALQAPGAAGFTITEMMVALVVFGIMASAAFGFMASQSRFYDAGGRVQTAQQEARGVTRIVITEIRRAGAGVNAMSASDPDIVIPNDGTVSKNTFDAHAVKLVSVNTSVPRVPLSATVGNGKKTRTFVDVPDTSSLGPLQVGDAVYIEDSNSGNTQLLRVTNITSQGGGRRRLEHLNDALEVDYPPSSSAVWIANEYRFRLGSASGDTWIERRLPGSTSWDVVSENGTDITFRYYDQAGTEITPNSAATRRAIRRIDISVSISIPAPGGRSGNKIDFTFKSSVNPRNLALGA